MDMADLRIFEVVAQTGGITRAALALNTVQSNVTARIRQLEADVGAPLFERHSRGVTLTAAGRRLLPYAVRAGNLLAEARRAVTDQGEPLGPLILGALETTAAVRLPTVLARFAAAHPTVDLVLQTGTTVSLVDEVLGRRLEGAFVAGPVNHPDLEEEALFDEELVVVTACNITRLDDLARFDGLKIVVFRTGCSYRQRLQSILADRGIVGVRTLEFGTLDGILGCVGAGIGITLLPRGVVVPAQRDGRVAVHTLPAAVARVATMFVRPRGAFRSSAMTAFLDIARTDHGSAPQPTAPQP